MDLIVDPNLPVATTEEQAVPQQTTSDTDDGGNSSASDISGQQKVSQVAPDANPLVSVLGQLSVSEPAAKENVSTVSVSGIDSSPKASGGENLPTIQQEQLSLLKSTGSPSNQPSNVPAVGTSNDQVKDFDFHVHLIGFYDVSSCAYFFSDFDVISGTTRARIFHCRIYQPIWPSTSDNH